jgi:G:T-mismatch repair DNA endonuclease (very short patch repair protein)
MLRSKGNVRSKLCDNFKQFLIEKGIEGFQSEQAFHDFVPDEINHGIKVIIEVFGDLYHCNPENYKDENQFVQAIGRTVGEQWKRDRIKVAAFARYGYKTIIVWEKNFRNDPKETVVEVIKQIDEIKHEFKENTA